MVRLTLRSGKDGRFLARIADSGGNPFVLDFGDRRIIEDIQQRLLHGFTMWRFGKLVTAAPRDVDMVSLLAEFYAGEGLLVALEEPTWVGREVAPKPVPRVTEASLLPDLPGADDQTELASIEEITDLGPCLENS